MKNKCGPLENMCKIYCDTCVYRDIFEGRKGKYRDFDEFALNLLHKVKEKQYKLVISDWVYEELKKHNFGEDFKRLIKTFEEEHLINVEVTPKDKVEARKLSSSNYPDALHVILAKKANAIYLVTRNLKDFTEFRDVIEIALPESL
ncbi:type II toxin-antitoxin system VapC family toxin [Nanoarchaeota archaeon]